MSGGNPISAVPADVANIAIGQDICCTTIDPDIATMSPADASAQTTAPPRALASIVVELLRERVRLQWELDDMRIDRDAHRTIAHEALHVLADLTARHRRQTERLHQLLDERRATRERAA